MTDGHEIAMSLRGAYLSMHRQAEAALSPYILTANQFVLLALLNDRDGVPQRDLVERASSDPNTIRPMLTSLEKKGHIVRTPAPHDGRVWLVHITTNGRRIFKTARRETNAFRERLCASLDDHERESLVRLLAKVAASANENVPR